MAHDKITGSHSLRRESVEGDAFAVDATSSNDVAVYSADHASGILLALAGMALQWAFLHSITFLGSVLGTQAEIGSGSAWIVNSLCTFTVFLAVFALSRRLSPLLERRSALIVVGITLLVGIMLVVVGNVVLLSPVCNYVGNALIACGTTPMIIMWGELYKYLNPKGEQLLVTLAAAALAVVLYLVVALLPNALAIIVFVLMPFASLSCMVGARDLLKESSGTWRARTGPRKRKSPALFFVCIAVFSLPYNYLRTTEGLQAVLSNPLDWASVLAVAVVVLVIIALAEAVAERRGALLVPGFVLLLLSAAMLLHLITQNSYSLVVPSLLYSGYYLFLAMVYLALGPIVATTDENPTRLFAGAMLANVAGLLLGSIMGGMEGWFGSGGATLAVLGVTYALLIVGFTLLNNRSYSLFRINYFDKDEYSFEYLVPLVPLERVQGGTLIGSSDGQSRTMFDAIVERCSTVGARYKLSARENEVLVALVRGRTIASIAEDLVVSENTVKAHTKAIYRKLAVHSREELLYRVEDDSEETER